MFKCVYLRIYNHTINAGGFSFIVNRLCINDDRVWVSCLLKCLSGENEIRGLDWF